MSLKDDDANDDGQEPSTGQEPDNSGNDDTAAKAKQKQVQEQRDREAAMTAADECAKKAEKEADEARKEADKIKSEREQQEADARDKAQKKQEQEAEDAEAEAEARAASNDGGEKMYPESYVKRLRAEAAKRREEAKTEREEREKLASESQQKIQTATSRATDLEKESVTTKRELAQIRVAVKKKLPLEMASRLVGDDEATMEKDADKLAKQLAPSGGSGFDQGSRGGRGGGAGRQSSKGGDWIRGMAGIGQQQ